MSIQYFAYADAGDAFSQAMARIDANILSLNVLHEEGQNPVATVVMKNPRIGLMAPGRHLCAWFSWLPNDSTSGDAEPLMFGLIDTINADLFAQKVTVRFQCRAADYISRKQAVAETLRVAPYYDPIGLTEANRDQPDPILEGWSSAFHIDRITQAWSASDLLLGEDGTVVFGGRSGAFVDYKSVKFVRGEAPLTSIQVVMPIHWTQRGIVYVDGPDVNIVSYTGDTFLSGWPKPGATLGGGWRVEESYADDAYLVSLTPMYTLSGSISFDEYGLPIGSNDSMVASYVDSANALFPGTYGTDCRVEHISWSGTFPALLAPGAINGTITSVTNIGLCNPTADPPVNRPGSSKTTGICVPLWTINASWSLRGDYKRQFSEIATFTLFADVQNVTGQPTGQEYSEQLTITGADVGQPVVAFNAWTDFAGGAVAPPQLIFPNNPTLPGGLSYQICVRPGIAGTVEPVFSDIVGTITIDGTVWWASLGTTPLTSYPDWTAATFVPVGVIVCYQPVVFNPANGTLETTGDSFYLLSTTAGETNSAFTIIRYVPAVSENVQEVPAVQEYSYTVGPDTTTFAEAGNGTVGWTLLGTDPPEFAIPVGGAPEHVTARCFFPTTRGQQYLQHGIARARARLRKRSRAVTVEWDCRFEDAVRLSCRMNATIFDTRLPGGQATGKIISYSFTADGSGKPRGHVKIGVAVGNGGAGTVAAVAGVGVYAAPGYMQPGYQQETGAIMPLGGGEIGDVGYSPPAFAAFDDGLDFTNGLNILPGTSYANQVVFSGAPPSGDSQTISGDLATQAKVIGEGIATAVSLANLSLREGTLPNAGGSIGAWTEVMAAFGASGTTVQYLMAANPIVYDMDIPPITNGPFNGSYAVTCTLLQISQGINLAAPALE